MIDKGNKSGPDGAKSFKFPSTEDTGKTAQDDVEYLDADKIAAAAGNFPKKPVEKPTVVINFKAFKAFQDSVNPSRDTHVQQLPVIKPKTEAQKPVDVNEKRKQKFDTVKGTKIVAIPLPGLKIDGKASELNLEIRYIPGTYSQGSFEVVGVKMASTGEPGILKKLGSLIGMKKKS